MKSATFDGQLDQELVKVGEGEVVLALLEGVTHEDLGVVTLFLCFGLLLVRGATLPIAPDATFIFLLQVWHFFVE